MKNKKAIISILLSLITIIIALIYAFKMAEEYDPNYRKSSLEVGLKNLERLYFSFLGLLALYFSTRAMRYKENIWLVFFSYCLSIFSIALTFSEIYRYLK